MVFTITYGVQFLIVSPVFHFFFAFNNIFYIKLTLWLYHVLLNLRSIYKICKPVTVETMLKEANNYSIKNRNRLTKIMKELM